eukprot:TRINITY_DN2565_c0_g1_i1.p1 TRINITY_DN2565_c0_g1~~TRINITY_DN2565_c0_g1_i1.p1  ORF type:complete len:301 (+),score=44.96 TRINITY_DN2565_c0_g1_i1:44-904(+)
MPHFSFILHLKSKHTTSFFFSRHPFHKMTSLPSINHRGKPVPLDEVYTTPIPIHVPSPKHVRQVEGSSPRWRIQTKTRIEGTRKCTLGNGLQVESQTPSLRGKKVFSEQRGKEYQWRSIMAQVPPPKVKERPSGKRFVAPAPLAADSVTGKMFLSGPASVHSEKLFQTRRSVLDENGKPKNCNLSKEFSAESEMTRKRISHNSSQKRNNVSLATLGDKAYAEPTYCSDYWVNAASTVPKCAVDKVAQSAVPATRASTKHTDEDHSIVSSLPKIPKDEAWWDFLKRK